jgi:membrane associated rhomboid family serine protease
MEHCLFRVPAYAARWSTASRLGFMKPTYFAFAGTVRFASSSKPKTSREKELKSIRSPRIGSAAAMKAKPGQPIISHKAAKDDQFARPGSIGFKANSLKRPLPPKAQSNASGVREEPTFTFNSTEDYAEVIEGFRRQPVVLGVLTFLFAALAYVFWNGMGQKYGHGHTCSSNERIQYPQTWYLTPQIVREGIETGFEQFDPLTQRIVTMMVLIYSFRRYSSPILKKLTRSTGSVLSNSAAFMVDRHVHIWANVLLHRSWGHVLLNAFALSWFLPGVVSYFDGDMYHTTAFLMSVPFLTSYAQHIAFRYSPIRGILLSAGADGLVAAAMGVYCTAYSEEKLWLPPFLILRLDAKYWAGLFALQQLYSMAKTPLSGNRTAQVVCIRRGLLEISSNVPRLVLLASP